MNAPTCWVDVEVETPAHSQIGSLLTYTHNCALPAGSLVRVPLGSREVLGVVTQVHSQPPIGLDTHKARSLVHVLDLPPLGENWLALVQFAARYYQRSIGEMAAQALPPSLHKLSPEQLSRRLKRLPEKTDLDLHTAPVASEQQSQALQAIAQTAGPFLLFGNTGSGKTEVYLQAIARTLQEDPAAQALLLVPEINLTPQLFERVQARFGTEAVVAMHSGLTPAQRLTSWLLAHQGKARIVLGTRMAIFASLPHLRMIVVDEEHDPSYKQQEGARYSARDLAIYRGKQHNAKVILGSATPSLESWHLSRPEAEGGRYVRLHMPARVGLGSM
ncbi:MAG: Primosomal protein, partial [Pseudomonadota bacterium]